MRERLTVHATRDLTRLLVAPPDGREVGLVVHEAGVEERLDIRVRALDVDLAARRGVLEVLEHRDVLARREERVVGICTSHDGAEHDRLVGLVLEVTVVKLVEFRAHLLQFLLGRADLIAFLSPWPNS